MEFKTLDIEPATRRHLQPSRFNGSEQTVRCSTNISSSTINEDFVSDIASTETEKVNPSHHNKSVSTIGNFFRRLDGWLWWAIVAATLSIPFTSSDKKGNANQTDKN